MWRLAGCMSELGQGCRGMQGVRIPCRSGIATDAVSANGNHVGNGDIGILWHALHLNYIMLMFTQLLWQILSLDETTAQLELQLDLPFGKHRGVSLAELPDAYIEWQRAGAKRLFDAGLADYA